MVPDLCFMFSSVHMPQLLVTEKVKQPLYYVFNYVQPITQSHMKSITSIASVINPVIME